MARIAVVGGHGKVALHLARELSARGDHVSSLIRTREQGPDVEEAGGTPLLADVEQLSVDDLCEVLAGHDAVVWSAGAGGGSRDRTYAVDRDAAIRTMEAAARADVRRFVMVSWFGSGPDHGVPEDEPFFAYADAKAAADAHLRETDLAWTVLGPSRLTLEPATGRIETGPGVHKGEVSREDVAKVVAAVLADDSTIGRTIDFNNGDTPIVEAVRGHAR